MTERKNQYRIGIDLGGTKTESLLLGLEGQELQRKRVDTPAAEGYQAILAQILDLIQATERTLPEGASATIGVGIPGMITPEQGLVLNANTTCLNGKPLQKDLEQKLGRNLAVENDANCFALAEARSGAGVGHELVFGVIMGTGCGGGLALNGHVRQGPNGIAGEWGHISIDPAGRECYCGNRGCVETKISGSGVEAAYLERFHHKLTMAEIVQSSRTGSDASRQMMETFLDDFGRALGGLISMLDPDAVVLGGGLSNINELYGPGLERVRKYAFHKNVKTPILRNKLGDSAGAIGAAWVGV